MASYSTVFASCAVLCSASLCSAEPVLSDLFEGTTPYARAGFSIGWAGDQAVRFGTPGPDNSVDFETLFGGSAAIGVDFGTVLGDDLADDPFDLGLRADIEVGYESWFYDGYPAPVGAVEDDDGELRVWNITANVFADIGVPGPITPIIGTGLGLAVLTLEEDGFDDTDTSAVWQWMAGAEARINDSTHAYLIFRQRVYLEDLGFAGTRLDDLSGQSIELGIRVSF